MKKQIKQTVIEVPETVEYTCVDSTQTTVILDVGKGMKLELPLPNQFRYSLKNGCTVKVEWFKDKAKIIGHN